MDNRTVGLSLVQHFDPDSGLTVIPSKSPAEGYWAGACSVMKHKTTNKFYLYYRVREPRPVRGGNIYIAESDDGLHYTTIWHATKEQFNSQSIEKSCLVQSMNGQEWYLYVSYVDPKDSRWKIDQLIAPNPKSFDVTKRRTILSAINTNTEGVKDPCVIISGDTYYMYYTYAHLPTSTTTADALKMHGAGDVYNTGITLASTGLAKSKNGSDWELAGTPLRVADSKDNWDYYCARICSVIQLGPIYVAFYDGSKAQNENYEEKTGIAVGLTLDSFYRLTSSGPALTSKHGTHSLRYVECLQTEKEFLFYYEYALANGSHELKLKKIPKNH